MKRRNIEWMRALLLCIFAGLCISDFAQSTRADQPATYTVTAKTYADVGAPLSNIYTAKEHGGHNQNWTSIQSSEGFIYVGHTTGISQWDGEQWRNVETPHSTPVRAIAQWRNALYFGTTNDLFEVKLNASGELSLRSLLSKLKVDSPEDISENLTDNTSAIDFGEIWSTSANGNGVVFVAENTTFFYDGSAVHEIKEAISSKHFIFEIANSFYYKPRHLDKVYTLDISQNNGRLTITNTPLPYTLPEQSRVMEILSDDRGALSIITEQHGVFQIKDNQLMLVQAPEAFGEGTQLYDAILSSDGLYYIGSTYSGLFVLDAALNIMRHYQDTDGISMNTVFSVNEDMQGNLWLTGIPNVVKMRPPHIISRYKAGNSSTEILRLINTQMGIFASGNGQFKLQLASDARSTPEFVPLSTNTNSSVDLMAYDNALIRAGWGGIYELPLNSDATQFEQEKLIVPTALGRIMQIHPSMQSIIASATDQAFLLSKSAGEWQVEVFPESVNQLVSMTLDDQDRLWFGSATSELFKLDGVSEFGVLAPLQTFTQADGLSAGPVDIFNINGEAIFSSAGRLLHYSDGELKDAKLAMLDDSWLNDSLIIDQMMQIPSSDSRPERIWYRKNGSSGYFEKSTSGQWTQNTYIFDSVEPGGFSSLFMTDNDILWFVRDKAEIYRVNVPLAQTLPASAPLNIRRLDSNGQLIAFKGDALQKQNLLSLSPEQSDLRFSYASTDSSSAAATEYRTRLNDNTNAPWSQWSQETYRDYTQLAPKQYRFELEARDAWGRITSTHLDFVVLAPWYLSKTAYAAYILLSLMAIFVFAWFVQKWRTAALEEANRVLELKVEARTKEVNDKVEQLRQQQILKDRFFGNVSHEFRTPLTLTIDPLQTIVSEHHSELTSSVSQLAQTALSNASRMLALVGLVLDMNRLEAGKLPLRVAQYDLAELLRNTGERFQSWAQQQDQDIEVIDCEEPMLLWFDIDQLDKCISNLLSNAIKYSGKGSRIQIQLLSSTNSVQIQVRDNGAGISEQAKDKVFERFYQDKSSENIAAPGTGIGLALVKELMQMHHGDAQLLDSEGSGCCFVLSLQKGNQHFERAQIVEPIAEESTKRASKADKTFVTGEPASLALSKNTAHMPTESEDLTTLLIVDDNKELLNFISLRLSASYRILQADNGLEGYEKACKELPDLIVSDVNMPIMTGLELAQKIKGNADTRTIPIILLTAKATKREVVAGFSVGADDYLTKPFDTSELIMRVNAQINARKLVRESQAASSSALPRKAITFEDKLFDAIQEHLTDPSFNAERLAASMHMSRDTLIRKCKKTCAETPLNLITEKRMQKADELLKANVMSISEVAYACGFESLAYFSKRYKKYRGLSPSQVSPSEVSPSEVSPSEVSPSELGPY